MSNIKNASLEDLRRMAEAGELYHNPDAPADVENLGADFWKGADWRPKEAPRSVHLKLDADVFRFFKQQGKGHLTRMQNVLRAYVLSHTSK